MKTMLIILVLSTTLLFSCETSVSPNESSPKICGVTDPINQLDWLQQLISSNTSCTIYNGAKLFSYKYNGKEVFYFVNPASSVFTCTSVVFNCDGSKFEISNWQDFETNRINEKLLWKK